MKNNEDILNEIIKQHERLIYKIAHQKFPTLNIEDLYQEGVKGILKAFKNYKENSLAKFSSYAYEYIFGEMYAYYLQNNQLKISKDILRLYRQIEEAKQRLIQIYKKEPTVEELSVFLEVPLDKIVSAEKASIKILSLDQKINEENDITYQDRIVDTSSINLDDKILLEEYVNKLQEPDNKIIHYRYFKDYTQSETAKILQLSQVKVSRYEKRGIETIRNQIAC